VAVREPIFDDPRDPQTIQQLLIDGEALEAVFDLTPPRARQEGSDVHLVAITSRRVILYSGPGPLASFQSVPYGSIGVINLNLSRPEYEVLSVSYRGSGGDNLTFYHRGSARRAHDLILAHLE
jgi:hypothetical protein